MPQVLRDNCVVEDNWTVLAEDADRLPKGDLLLSYSQWQTFADQIDSHDGDIGVIIEGNSEIEEIIEPLLDLPVIAINFPKFADGRGFSTARLIRERYNYSGEIRAVGGFCVVLTAQQGDLAALVQHLNLGKRPQAKFWSGQISEDARRTTEFIFDVAKATVEVGFVLGFAVRVVETTDVNARFHERHERRTVVASRPDGRHDSRASHRDHPHM